jgi:hypothetical protein
MEVWKESRARGIEKKRVTAPKKATTTTGLFRSRSKTERNEGLRDKFLGMRCNFARNFSFRPVQKV